MRRVKRVVALMAAAGLALGLGGCVEPDPEEASTPADAPTVVNSAPQTDSKGNTVPVPGAESPGGEATEEVDPAVAAGQTVFESTCQGCHANLGQDAGVGPKLAGGGRAEDLIRTTVEKGRSIMPPGLATGEDLDNVVAFVLSIQ